MVDRSGVDRSGDTRKLESLVRARRDELRAERLADPSLTPEVQIQPSIEEQLLQSFQNKLLTDRLKEEKVRRNEESAEMVKTERRGFFALVAIAVAYFPAAFTAVAISDDRVGFTGVAISAGIIGVIAAALRVIAHGIGSKLLDGFGKTFGLVSAELAVLAAVVLSVVLKVG